ncbi:hypothetical protein RIF29_17373 [Crotalaria pallida]|uniref:Uncharacterized protein n=1 Tax=Crotalaria pallida TaxID=3830 RepID=A0AAN9IKD4_CROPI
MLWGHNKKTKIPLKLKGHKCPCLSLATTTLLNITTFFLLVSFLRKNISPKYIHAHPLSLSLDLDLFHFLILYIFLFPFNIVQG